MALDSAFDRTGLTDAQIAERISVSAEAVRLWRRGLRRVSHKHARRLETELGIPKHELRPDIYDAPHPGTAA